MNPILLLIIMLAALVLVAFIINHILREEVINAKAPQPDAIQAEAIAEVEAMTPSAAPKGISEEEITAKVAVGLTRDQAIQVLKNQLAEDAAAAKESKKKA